MRGGERAWTLVEMLVGLAVFALLTTVLAMFLLAVSRGSARSSVRSTLQSQALVVLSHLASDLERATPQTLWIVEATPGAPAAAGMILMKDMSPMGSVEWEEELVVYGWFPEGRLVRRTWPPPPPDLDLTLSPSAPPSPTPEDLLSVVRENGGPTRLLARDLDSFSLSKTGDGSLVVCELGFRRKAVSGDRVEEYSLRRTFQLRNSP